MAKDKWIVSWERDENQPMVSWSYQISPLNYSRSLVIGETILPYRLLKQSWYGQWIYFFCLNQTPWACTRKVCNEKDLMTNYELIREILVSVHGEDVKTWSTGIPTLSDFHAPRQ